MAIKLKSILTNANGLEEFLMKLEEDGSIPYLSTQRELKLLDMQNGITTISKRLERVSKCGSTEFKLLILSMI